MLALAGDNGAGKSTLIKAISGVHQPDEGEIVYKGEPVDPRATRATPATIGIETIYQDLALADNLDVGANIFLGREPAAPAASASCRASTAAACATAARDVLATLDVDLEDKKLGLPVRSLSGGQRQAVAIGRAIFWKAELLIMDEPTAALGVPEQRKVIELIQAPAQAGRGRDLHQPQSGRHLRRRRPHPGAPPRPGRRRTPAGAEQPRRDRAADGRRLAGQSGCSAPLLAGIVRLH